MSLKTSYLPETTFGAIYRGGGVAFEPVSGCLLCPESNNINFLNLSTGALQYSLEGVCTDISWHFSIAQDGSSVVCVASSVTGKIAFAVESNQILVFQKEAIGDAWIKLSQFRCNNVRCLSWDPSGTLVAASCSTGIVQVNSFFSNSN